MSKEVQILEERMAKGDEWFATHGKDDPKYGVNWAKYWEIADARTQLRLAEESRMVVVLELPPWATTEDGGHTVRVCIEGQRHDGELDRDDLSVLCLAMAEGQEQEVTS